MPQLSPRNKDLRKETVVHPAEPAHTRKKHSINSVGERGWGSDRDEDIEREGGKDKTEHEGEEPRTMEWPSSNWVCGNMYSPWTGMPADWACC